MMMNVNSVNGSEITNDATASLGSACYAQQVALGRHQATASKSKDKRNIYKISTWNVRTLYQGGKLANVENEMERLKIDIMGIGEMRWPGSGEMTTEKNRKVIYSGGDTANRGVGIIMENDIHKKLIGYWPISHCIIMMKLKGKPFNINIIQVYAPTEDSTEEVLEDFYEELTRIREQCKNRDINIIMGDMNAKVRNGRHEDIVGQYGLGEKNTRGQKLIDWCTQHQKVITDIWFRHHPRRLWTWRSPGDRNRNQIDYITINRRFRNAIHQAKTYPGADCNSDHNLLVATVEIKRKKVITTKITARRKIDVLKKNREIKKHFCSRNNKQV